MSKYIFKRILQLVPILFFVSLIIFSIMHLAPGDPATIMLGDTATPQQIQELRVQLGLDAPIYKQYLNWMGGILKGDLGHSYFMRQSVVDAISSHIIPTLSLATYSVIIAVVVGLLFGIIAAVNRGTIIDHAASIISLFGVSVPNFLLAMILVLLFAVRLRWLPAGGYRPINQGVLMHIKHMTLPAVSIGFMMIAMISRMTRASMLETLFADFIKTARAKGLREKKVVLQHAFRNAFLPVLTIIGRMVSGSLTGAVVVETIFNIPGIGQLLVSGISRRDYPIVQGIVLLIVFVNVFFNLIVDLMYGAVDPRVRLDQK